MNNTPDSDGSLPNLSSDGMESHEKPRPKAAEKERKQIGPYKILQKIAEGGMGAVYMAEQSQPIKRRVALKLIKAGRDTEQIIARFDAERQALAMMDHANIARIFDAGTTDDGAPYFVMELVNGIPLTDYCDRNKLSIRERMELFVPVCKAVQHAHTKGIIHRDLKPSNVLVALYDGVPVPKVIDFGLAKATEHQLALTEKTMFTEFGQIVGTLQYMSPEQAEMNQLDVDARTDVYSLGVMLYELLTGSTPLDNDTMKEHALLKVLEMIREKEPPRPSTRLSSIGDTASTVSQQRRIAQSRLQQILKGELDWIVMNALDKNRERRYETANRFADDIQRFLHGDAVLARPPSKLYRLGKFVKQNLAAVITGLLFALVLIVATITSINYALVAQAETAKAEQQRKRAEREKEGQEKVTHLFTNVMDAGDPVFGQLFSKYGGTLGRAASMEDVVRRVANDELAERSELADVPGIRAQLLSTLADIHLAYGDVRQAFALYQKADELYRKEKVSTGAELGRNHLGLGTCAYLLGDLKASENQLVSAEKVSEVALSADPENAEIVRDLAFGLFVQAVVRIEFEDFEQAETLLTRTAELCDSNESKTLDMMGSFSQLFLIGSDVYRRSIEGDSGIDLKFFAQVRGSVENLNSEGTLFEPFQGVMTAEALATLGKDATPAYKELHRKLSEVVGDDHFLTLFSRFGLSEAARRFSDFETANRHYEDMIAFAEKHVGRNHSRFAMILQKHAILIFDHWKKAETPNEAELRKARDLLLEAVTIRRKQLGEHRQTASSLYWLARVEASLKNDDVAVGLYNDAMKIRVSRYGPVSKPVSSCHFRIVTVLQRLGKHQAAVTSIREMLTIDQQLLAKNVIKRSEFGFRQQFAAHVLVKSDSADQQEIRELLTESLRSMKEESRRYKRPISDAQKLLDDL